jgi:CO/xanthine dehydrogenase Mo-binding subunit
MSIWKVHGKDDVVVDANPKANFPISIELTFGTTERTPARMEKGCGAWFSVEDAQHLIKELQRAVDRVRDAEIKRLASEVTEYENALAMFGIKKCHEEYSAPWTYETNGGPQEAYTVAEAIEGILKLEDVGE